MILQERDRRFLLELGRFRWADRELAKRMAGFGSTTRANARLLALLRAGFLHRFFTGSVAAGRKAVYALSSQGAAIVGVERIPKHKHTDTTATDLFVDHQLELNGVVLAAQLTTAPAAARIVQWRYFDRPVAKSSKLIPDGYVEVQTPGGLRALFLEVDLGTESHRIWEKKVEAYLQFARSGDFEQQFQHSQFRVLVLAGSAVRIENIRKTVCRSTEKIFWFSTFEQIHRDGFWAPVWLRPTGDRRLSLL